MKYIKFVIVIIFILSLTIYIRTNSLEEKNTDTTIPQIICDEGILELSVNDPEERLFEGLSAWDEKDGNLTEHIMIAEKSDFVEKGMFNVKYVVFDSDYHSAEISRTVYYTDYEYPIFSLAEPLVFLQGSKMNLLSYIQANDMLDGNITRSVRIINDTIDSSHTGSFPLELEVTNSYGGTASLELNVIIISSTPYGPKINLSDYLVYVKRGESFNPMQYISSVLDVSGQSIDPLTVTVSGNVDINTTGFYHLTYLVVDSGREGRTYLTVAVTE